MDLSERQGHRLLQVGFVIFFFALLLGLAVPRFTVPRLGLSAHLLALMQALFLVSTGLLWPKLTLAPALRRVTWGLAIYGCVAALSANVLAGAWGAGGELLPQAGGQARGTVAQEWIIFLGLRSGAAALIASVALIIWGLHLPAPKRHEAPQVPGSHPVPR